MLKNEGFPSLPYWSTQCSNLTQKISSKIHWTTAGHHQICPFNNRNNTIRMHNNKTLTQLADFHKVVIVRRMDCLLNMIVVFNLIGSWTLRKWVCTVACLFCVHVLLWNYCACILAQGLYGSGCWYFLKIGSYMRPFSVLSHVFFPSFMLWFCSPLDLPCSFL